MYQRLFKNFNPEALKKYFFNTYWLLVEKCIRLLVGLVVGVFFLVKYLGAENFGKLEYARSFVMLFSAFASLGLQEIIARDIIKHPKDSNKILGTSFGLKIIGAVCVFLLINGLSFLLPDTELYVLSISQDQTDRLLILISSCMLFFTSFDVITFYFQSQVRSFAVVKVQIVVMLVGAVLKLLGIYYKYSLLYFALIISSEFAMMAVGFCIIYWQGKYRFREWKFDVKLAKRLLKDAYPLMLSTAMVVIYMRIDQIMIKQMLGDASNGNYSIAVRLSEAWYFVPSIISASVFPAILHARAKNTSQYYKRLQQLFDLLVALGVCAGVCVFFLAKPVMNLIGDEFTQATFVLQIHIWGGIFVALGVASSKWLLAENFTHISLHRTFMGAIINILLNLVLIPRWGVVGSAWATLFSSICVAYLFDFFHSKTRRIFWMKTKSLSGFSVCYQIWQSRKGI